MAHLLEMKPYEDFAASHGYKLNPDKDMAHALVRSLIEREKRFGKRYCPCRKLYNDAKKDDLIVCPCAFVHDDIEKYGRCRCGLFYGQGSSPNAQK